jgi:DNA-binding NarL/FixJ family response regulator
MQIRVLLVDDQPLVRAGLRVVLRPEDGFEVVGEAGDGLEALAMAARLQPDVLLIDLRMPGMDGAETIRRLGLQANAPPALVLTTFDDDEALSSALHAGAAGFQLKDASAEELIRAVRIVAAGGACLDPAVTARVLAAYRSAPPLGARHADLDQLTPRELEVLSWLGRGTSNEEIADALAIGKGTVKTHVRRIFDKLRLRDRAAAVVFAFDHGLVRAGDGRAPRSGR